MVDTCLAIDIGGTSIKSGHVDASGSLVGEIRTTAVGDDPLATVLGIAREAPDTTRAIGVGSPGYLSADRTQVAYAVNLGWRDVDLVDRLQDATGRTVVLEGDANAAALAESRVGAGQGQPSVLVVTLGTGIGIGFTVQGQVFLGAQGFAGQAGHMPVHGETARCDCGRVGCWEISASTRGFERMLEGTPLEGLGAREALRRSALGDAAAQEAVHAWTARITAGLIPLICMLDPACIVIAGAVSESGSAFLPQLRERIAHASAGQVIGVYPASLGPAAGVIGAGLLAWDQVR